MHHSGHRTSPAVSPRRILVLKPSSLGDIVHTLPSLHRLRSFFPHAHIDWVVNPEWADVLQGNPAINSLIVFPRRSLGGPTAPLRFVLWARRALPRHPDLAVDFQGLLRTALMGWLAGARRLEGFSLAREGAPRFYTHRVNTNPGMHSVERYLALASGVVRTRDPIPQPDTVQFWLPEGNAPQGFDARTPWLLLHPFSRGKGKSLSPDALRQLVHSLLPRRVVLVGRHPNAPEIHGGLDLCNKTTLPELIWLARHAVGVLSVDSGPMHLAAACNPRVLGIHSWTDPRCVGPYSRTAFIWQNGRIVSMSHILDARPGPVPSPMPSVAEAGDIAQWIHAHWR